MLRVVNWPFIIKDFITVVRVGLKPCVVGEGSRALSLSANMSDSGVLSPPESVRGKVIKTAGAIIIGDEVLKGLVKDENSYFLCQRFHALGVRLAKMSVLPDSVEDIAREVKEFSEKYDVVVTTGGIGPTHDDLTYESVCAAFGDSIIENERLKQFWGRFYPPAASSKMSRVPSTAELIFTKVNVMEGGVPIVHVKNVYIFPGIPKYVRVGFRSLEKEHFSSPGSFYWRNIYLLVDESVAVEAMDSTVAAFPQIQIGSYPEVENPDYATKIVLEGTEEAEVSAAEEFLRQRLETNWQAADVVSWRAESPAALNRFIASISDTPFSSRLIAASKVVDKCMEQYGMNGVFVCFNGGKDCTALVHLTFCQISPVPLQAVYIRGRDTFPEMDQFIQETAHRYGMTLTIVDGPIKPALEGLLKKNPDWKAVLMGTRRSDPYAESMLHFQETDKSWPRVMRVNPLLDWSYEDVWFFLRELNIPYCSLYDKGYTSIGSQANTARNERLAYTENGQILYLPAYTLSDHSSERQGRI